MYILWVVGKGLIGFGVFPIFKTFWWRVEGGGWRVESGEWRVEGSDAPLLSLASDSAPSPLYRDRLLDVVPKYGTHSIITTLFALYRVFV